MKKIVLAIIIVVAIVASLILYKELQPSQEDEIVSFVEENKIELEEISEKVLNGDEEIKDYKTVVIDGTWGNGDNQIVQFMYEGVGIASAGKYYGFYYSPNDIPQSYQCEKKVVTDGDDSWKWTSGGDDGGITKKICDKWYYFEAWF